MPKDTKLKKYEDVLMAALHFNEEDLAANEAGSFSAAQVQSLKRQRLALALSVGSLIAIVTLLMLFAHVYAGGLAPLVIVFLFVLALVLLISGLAALQITRDLQAGLQMVEGRVDLDMRPGQNSATYYVKVNGKKFKVKKRAFLAFKNGDPYRIYYAPHAKTILSVDWLRDDDPFVEQPNRDDTVLEDQWHDLPENDYLRANQG